jgi:hypothetical protein
LTPHKEKTVKRLIAVMVPSVLLAASSYVLAQDTADNPIADIAADMTVVVRDLNQLSTGKPTQETQKEIVSKLDELIAQLEKECAACKAGAKSRNPKKPLTDSIVKNGPGGQGDLHAPRNNGKKFGELPPHQRDKILQSQTEGFPSHYQQILERYYKRLAEERPAGESEASDKPDSKKPAAPDPAGGGN